MQEFSAEDNQKDWTGAANLIIIQFGQANSELT